MILILPTVLQLQLESSSQFILNSELSPEEDSSRGNIQKVPWCVVLYLFRNFILKKNFVLSVSVSLCQVSVTRPAAGSQRLLDRTPQSEPTDEVTTALQH